MSDTMREFEDARQRFFTEGTEEARLAYQAEVAAFITAGHEEIELDCGPNDRDCGGVYSYNGPCGGCASCLHGRWSYAMEEYRAEAGWRTY